MLFLIHQQALIKLRDTKRLYIYTCRQSHYPLTFFIYLEQLILTTVVKPTNKPLDIVNNK